ncbi:MAG: molybdenum cofactor biosynthesis protein A [Candidatus Omnitrophica bacterium ADurb.Bin292]|nr:MAG: molybdenum cofactor biosynthesis protein A [Candidatus Omnitrophica bacterium ADurb.Bin292]
MLIGVNWFVELVAGKYNGSGFEIHAQSNSFMTQHPYQYIYGPVASWRLGCSLGIDPLSTAQKTCSFDCVYCQAGRTKVLTLERKVFVPTEALLEEVRRVPSEPFDVVTFAGNGEPTLALNLGDMIRGIRTVRSERIVVITNGSLIWRPDVRDDLALADLVMAKLDAGSPDSLKTVNHPAEGLDFEEICEGLRVFRKNYPGKLALQIMFVASNKKLAADIANRAQTIHPDEIEVNTPLRACAVRPLTAEEMVPITDLFRKTFARIPVKSVYEEERKKSQPYCRQSTDRRRGQELV